MRGEVDWTTTTGKMRLMGRRMPMGYRLRKAFQSIWKELTYVDALFILAVGLLTTGLVFFFWAWAIGLVK